MPHFYVEIRLGDESWNLIQVPHANGRPAKVTDGVRVLSGLDFGWAMPGPVWPRQPDPMTAVLTVTVPNFEDVSGSIVKGALCSIEVRSDEGGTDAVVGRFYGDITNAKATARVRRPGVNISVIAVDPTVRNAEAEYVPYADPGAPWIDPGMIELEVLNGLWYSAGIIPNTTSLDAIWTSPERRMGSLGTDPAKLVKLWDFTKSLLDQAVDASADTRMIVSPWIDAFGGNTPAPVTGRTFTLDTLGTGDTFEVPASAVERASLGWANAKGLDPGKIIVESKGGSLAFDGVVEANILGTDSETNERLAVNCYTEAEAQDVADYYAGDYHGLVPWQLDTFTVNVSRAGIGDSIDAGLFPNWKADEGDSARHGCYTRNITITDVATSRTPFGADFIGGILTGARCRIAGGELTMPLTIRRPPIP